MWWLWLIIGALTWQAITVIVFVLSHEDEGITAMVGGGGVLITIWVIVTSLRRLFRRIKGVKHN